MDNKGNHIRQRLYSDGTLRTWKWPFSLGENYSGEKVVMTEEAVELSDKRKEELRAIEEKGAKINKKIEEEARRCWAAGVNFLAS